MDHNLTQKIFDEYELSRTRKKAERDERVKRIYSLYPRLEEIKKEQNIAGAKNITAVMKNPAKAEELNAGLKRTLETLEDERQRIMRENGIASDFDKIRYECPYCCDTGYVGRKKCRCFSKKLLDAAYSRSNLGELMQYQSFESFNAGYYPDKASDDGGSIREHMLAIKRRCEDFCDNFESKKKGFLFYGNAGLGKTFLSSCIAKRLIERGFDVIYITASQLFSAYDSLKFGKGDEQTHRRMIDSFKECDLLIIDDLGTEASTKYTESYLFDVVNERIISGKKMIINTNYSMAELTSVYTKRFTSRIYEFFNVTHFVGDDIRLSKAMKRPNS